MSEFISVLVALAAVIGLIFLTLYVTKRVMKKFNFKGSGDRGIKILDCAGVGQDKFIAAVSAGEKKLLLGVTSSGINVLCELSDEDIAAMFPPDDRTDAAMTFGECLSQAVREKIAGGKKDGNEKK